VGRSWLSGEEIEAVPGILLCREHPTATCVKHSSGGGGIDVWVPNGEVATVCQIKGYTGNIDSKAPAFRQCPISVLIEVKGVEGFGGGGVVASACGDVQVAGVFDGRDDGGADGSQVGGPAGGGVFAGGHVRTWWCPGCPRVTVRYHPSPG
jgi:hypothetical protein